MKFKKPSNDEILAVLVVLQSALMAMSDEWTAVAILNVAALAILRGKL